MRERSVISKGGEVIVPSSGETAEDISRASVVDKAGVILGGDLNIVKPNDTLDPAFLAITISNGNQQKELSKRAQGKSVVHISNSDLKDVVLQLPTLTEQTSISNFFRTLDSSIAMQKRKCEGLRKLKAAYLQQMFPQSGENLPRLRFSGFTDNWEEKRLGDISNKIAEKNGKREFTETFTNSAEHGIISQRDFFDKDISNEKNLDGYYIVRPDDFVYNPRISNFAPVGPIKRNLLGRTGVMSPLYYVFRVVAGDHTFIEKYFESIYWHEFMKLNGDNGVRADRFNIKDSVFEEMPIPFPSIEEQEAIGIYLRNIDEQISTHQAKLDKLKHLKQAYLKKMFV